MMGRTIRAMLWQAAHDYLATLVRLALGSLGGFVCAALFSLWRFLSESGHMCCGVWGDPNTGYSYYHAGWGYGPTTLWFVLVAWTIAAVVLVYLGKPGGR